MTSKKAIPLTRALLYIALSTLLFSGSCSVALLYYHHFKDKQRSNSSFTIVALVQTSPESEGLKTVYLAELLGLSIDQPRNLYAFSISEAELKILSSPLIKEATVRKIRPGTIHVDYLLRKPIAFLADYSNTAMDHTGYLFPFKPFFTPKKLPEIYLGNVKGKMENAHSPWGVQLAGKKLELAFDLLELAHRCCCDECSALLRIDLFQSDALSSGREQIVMVFEERQASAAKHKQAASLQLHTLRLTPSHYHQELANYLQLRDYMRKDEKFSGKQMQKNLVIDLRLNDLAFIAFE